MSRDTSHHTWSSTKVSAEAPSSLGLRIADLRRFLADVDAAGIPDGQHISVGGVEVHTESYGRKDCWAHRISVTSSAAEIARAQSEATDDRS